MDIRRLTASDAEAWWHLRLQMLRDDSLSFAESVEEHKNMPLDTAGGRLAGGDPAENFVLGLFEDGKLGGTAGFFRSRHNKERHKGNIWGVYVQPESRGK